MEKKTRVIDYARILKYGATAATEDCKLFNKWERGEMTLRECFEQFMKHSKVREVDETYWDPEQFKTWLRGLGYFKPYEGE